MSDTPSVYGGEFIHVDVETGDASVEEIDADVARRFLGGNGFGAKIIAEHVPTDADAFDPANVVVFTVGPLNTTPLQSTSRGVVNFISPMTEGFFDSTFGGSFPRAQKTTGFEAIAVHGAAEELSYVVVDEQGAQVKPAPELAGLDTYETCAAIREREAGDDTHVIAAGPAGENLVRYACLLHEGRDREGVAGRGGSAAVLGSKQIKAVAVTEGSFEPEVAQEDAFRQLTIDRMEPLMNETEMLQNLGTAGLVNPVNEMGKLGVRNNQTEQTDETNAEAISGEHLADAYVTEHTTCANCVVRCGKHVAVDSQDIEAAKIPEFETLFATATMQDVFDPDLVIPATDLCDRYGMDTISWGVTLSFARECAEHGLLEANDTPLAFGDAEELVELAEKTAHREGFGDSLAAGSFRLAENLDEEARKYLHGSKGLEFAAHSPRGLKGMSIGYATSTRGGSHHDTRPTLLYGGEHELTTEGTPEFAARSQHFTALGDSLTQCRFVSEGGYGKMINERYRDTIAMATGWDLTLEEVETVGERIYNLERQINVQRGIANREQDTLPHRVMHEPIPGGPAAGMHCPPDELETMLDEYYRYRGWDDHGYPTPETLERLDLAKFA